MLSLFLSIPFVCHIPLTIGCSNRYFSIASVISRVDRLEVINSPVLPALLRAAGKWSEFLLNAYEPAAAYHRSVRLLYQISIINLIII